MFHKHTPETYFRAFVERIQLDPDTGCWNWTGFLSPKGYGLFTPLSGNSGWVHRTAFKMFKGNIPIGLEVDHECRNRRCVNPRHLRAVTHFVNTDHDRRKTHCKNGHDITQPENYYVIKTKYGTGNGRSCKICAMRRSMDRWHRLKAQGAIKTP